MRKILISTLLTLGLAATASAEGNVQVRFGDINQFADFGESVTDREANQKALTLFLQSLGRRLPAGQQLQITVKDVNLAGEPEWLMRRAERLRVLRSSSVPSIDLSYTLVEGGRTIRSSDKEEIRDLGYLDHFVPGRYSSEGLKYEMRMLEKWFAAEVLSPRR